MIVLLCPSQKVQINILPWHTRLALHIVTNKIFDFEPKLKISNLFSMLKKLFTAGCRHLQNTKIEEEFTKNSMHRNVD